MEGVTLVTDLIMGAEVVVEVARAVELMRATRGLTILVMVVAHQQALVRPQNEGQASCVSLGVSFCGRLIVLAP